MKLSSSVLVESKAARDQGLSIIDTQDLQCRLLQKVKGVFFTLWRKSSYLNTEQIASYYEVSEEVIRQNLKRHRGEFESDGVQRIEGDDLISLRDTVSRSQTPLRDTVSRSRARYLTLYPPRAVIRMGFIIQGSEVAAQVRTGALNIIEGVGELISDEQILSSLVAGNSPYSSLIANSRLKVSTPLEPIYPMIQREIKTLYSDGGIPGHTKQDIREKLAALSTYSRNWKLTTQGELKFKLHTERAKCPDLFSEVIPVNVDGALKTAVFMFQIESLFVDPDTIETCLGRQYIRRARQALNVDYAYLFLVAPFGATPDAHLYIETELPSDVKGFVGAITVKELAEFLRDQAWKERTVNTVKGQISTRFSSILNYRIPDDPLSLLMGLTFN